MIILIDEIIWTMKDRSSIEPFLNEHYPERVANPELAGFYTVDGGTVYVTGNRIIFKERS